MSDWPEFAKCINCQKEKRMKYLTECTHCNQDVCKSTTCCSEFPCANKENIIICQVCQDKIEQKFILVIDSSKLQLLKGKIKNSTTRAKVN